MIMFTQNRTPIIAVFLSLSAILANCGGEAYHESPNPGSPTGGTGGGSGGGGGSTPTPTPTVSPTPILPPPLPFSFSITGLQGTAPVFNTPTSPPIDTDTLLRVRITAGPAAQLSIPTYSNGSSPYSCVRFKVTAFGSSIVTESLAVSDDNGLTAGPCPGANQNNLETPKSQIIDFSQRLGPGHGPVEVKVEPVDYDFYCKLYIGCQQILATYPPWDWHYQACVSFTPNYYSVYCPMKTIYRNHTVTGKLEIQINGTSL